MNVYMTEARANTLWETAAASFYEDQPERFEIFEGAPAEITGGTLYWCASASDAILLMSWEQEHKDACVALLADLSEEFQGWCVLSDQERS